MFSTWHKLWKSQKPSKNHDVNTMSFWTSNCRLKHLQAAFKASERDSWTPKFEKCRNRVISFLFELKTKKSRMPGSTTEEQVHSWRASRTLRGFHVQKTKTIQKPIEQRQRVSNVMAQALLGYLQALLRYSIFYFFSLELHLIICGFCKNILKPAELQQKGT